MTDRIHGLTVALEQPIRADDVEELVKAIKCLRGVVDVSTHVCRAEDYFAYSRAHRDIEGVLWDALAENKKKMEGR